MKMRSNPFLFIHGHKFKIAIDFGDFLVDFLGGLVSEAIGKRLILPKKSESFCCLAYLSSHRKVYMDSIRSFSADL